MRLWDSSFKLYLVVSQFPFTHFLDSQTPLMQTVALLYDLISYLEVSISVEPRGRDVGNAENILGVVLKNSSLSNSSGEPSNGAV